MEPLSTTFTITPRDVLQSYRAIARRAYLTRCVGSLAAVVVGILTRAPLLVALGVAWYVIAEAWVRRQLRRHAPEPRTVTVTITEDEYRVQGPDATTSRRWAMFESVQRVKDFWVLRISNVAGMALPADALDAEQTAAFEDLVARKGLLQR